MCTAIILRRPASPWPVLIAANRDELATRPWLPPGRHWPDRAEVIAGQDVLAGGTWLGINEDGVAAMVLNRPGTLGPEAGMRSRGELVLEALDHAEARVAAEALFDLNPASYRPFNLVIADPNEAFWLRHAGRFPSFRIRTPSGAWREIDPLHMPAHQRLEAEQEATIQCYPIPDGVSMITANDLNDPASPLIHRLRPRFASAAIPDPKEGDWQAWIELLGLREPMGGDPRSAMNVVTEGAFGTVCSQLVALPRFGPPRMLFAGGRPDEAPFEMVAI